MAEEVRAGWRVRPPWFTHMGRRRTIHVSRCGLRKNSADKMHERSRLAHGLLLPALCTTYPFLTLAARPEILRKTQFDNRDVHIPVTPSMSLHARPRPASTSRACRHPGAGHPLLFYHRPVGFCGWRITSGCWLTPPGCRILPAGS